MEIITLDVVHAIERVLMLFVQTFLDHDQALDLGNVIITLAREKRARVDADTFQVFQVVLQVRSDLQQVVIVSVVLQFHSFCTILLINPR